MNLAGDTLAQRSRRMSLLLLPILLHLATNGYGAAEPSVKLPCRQHPQLAAPCFQVRGRLSVYNGAPALRIWPIGSKRLLGISEGRFLLPNYQNIPANIVAQLVTPDSAMFADFVVCPFTQEVPGVMQLVCVDSAKNILVRKRD
jgi:hypothetical protein